LSPFLALGSTEWIERAGRLLVLRVLEPSEAKEKAPAMAGVVSLVEHGKIHKQVRMTPNSSAL
jgi:hypothetical protein